MQPNEGVITHVLVMLAQAWSIAVRQPKNLTIVAGSTALVALLSFLPEAPSCRFSMRIISSWELIAASGGANAPMRVEQPHRITCKRKQTRFYLIVEKPTLK